MDDRYLDAFARESEEAITELKHVDETTRTTAVKHVSGNEVIKHDDDIYPVAHLGERFDAPGAAGSDRAVAGDGNIVHILDVVTM
jgi:two-component system chemotaxis sensor kinase CheA